MHEVAYPLPGHFESIHPLNLSTLRSTVEIKFSCSFKSNSLLVVRSRLREYNEEFYFSIHTRIIWAVHEPAKSSQPILCRSRRYFMQLSYSLCQLPCTLSPLASSSSANYFWHINQFEPHWDLHITKRHQVSKEGGQAQEKLVETTSRSCPRFASIPSISRRSVGFVNTPWVCTYIWINVLSSNNMLTRFVSFSRFKPARGGRRHLGNWS